MQHRWLYAFLLAAFFPVVYAATVAGPRLIPSSEHQVLHSIVSSVQADKLHATLSRLVGFGTRHTLSDTKSETKGIGAARRWVKSRFQQISRNCGNCLEVITPEQTVTGERISAPTRVVDIVAIQKGNADPGRYILITAHLDSRVTDIMNSSAVEPGADDDGSGVAAVLETARILSQYKFRATVVYAALSGEEQGLYGGRILAAYAKAHHWRIEADLNNDIVGNIQGIDGVIDNTTVRIFSEGTKAMETPEQARYRRYHGGEVDSPSRNVARYIKKLAEQYIPNWHAMMVYRTDRFGRGGDQVAFNALGYPAVRISETHENYTRQHQDIRIENGIHYGDVLAGVNFPYLSRVTAMNAIAMASMAWAPSPPSGVQISGAVTPDTTLRWHMPTPGDHRDVAGFRIYWRLTTEPVWTHSIYIGKTDHYTLKNIVIDNYFFGVSSVSRDGFESPVVFPGPTGAFE